jgi:tRNA (cmo5U34)-methyltransferase
MPPDANQPIDFVAAFSDPEAVARYADGPRRFVPGFEALHRMTAILLAEAAPPDARILVLGAGGGLELKALAEAQPGWTFVGIDPAGEMLREAERLLGPLMDRVTLVEGYIDDAPAGPFDAATCLLTLHFLDAVTRERTLRAIHRRLRPGAPFVAAHVSFPQQEGARGRWLDRHAAYPIASGFDPELARKARLAVDLHLPALDAEDDDAMLSAAGFREVEQFFHAFTWRGWVGHA